MYGVKRALVAFAVLLGSSSVRAQVVQDDWLDPALPDFGTTITVNEKYTIRWTRNLFSWFPRYAPSADVTDVALWFQSTTSDDEFRIRSSVNINTTQSIEWLVDVPSDMLISSTRWSFQFRPTGSDAGTSEEVSSPQVVVRNAVTESPTETEDEAEPTETGDDNSEDDSSEDEDPDRTSDAATEQSGPAETTESSSGGSSVSGGAIAGIVIGSLAVLVIGAGVFLFWKRKGRKDSLEASAAVFAHSVVPKPPVNEMETKGTYLSEAELPGTTAGNIHSSSQFPPSELDGSHGRYP